MADHYDLVLKGGHVVDPATGLDGAADVAFAGGAVAAVAPSLDTSAAREVRDASGRYVSAGFIDLHTHVYWGGSSLGVDAVQQRRDSGVTTAVDTGSAGPGNFKGFRAHVIEPSPVRILAYLHISHAGVFAFSNRVMVGESEDIRLMDPRTAVEVVEANRDVIVGMKVRVGRRTSGVNGLAPLETALQVAEQTGTPLMAHIDEPPPSYAEVVSMLRSGDVLTHCFRPFPNTPILASGAVRDEVLAARERGVVFDIGHGMGSFSFDVARRMLAAGFPPDAISSDIHTLCIDGPVFDQATTLSKFLSLGMPLDAVIRATTIAPAKAVLREDLGTLAPGAAGDAVMFDVEEGRFDYVDSTGAQMVGDKRLAVRGLVADGAWVGEPEVGAG